MNGKSSVMRIETKMKTQPMIILPVKISPRTIAPATAPKTPSRLRISAVWVEVVCLWATFWVTRANTVPRKML